MSSRAVRLGIAGALAVMSGAAALSVGIADRPAPAAAAPRQAPKPLPAQDRVTISEAQLIQAYATGALDRPVKSLLNIREQMDYGDFRWNDRDVPQGPVFVRIDLESQLISVFRGGHEIGTAVILYGAEEKATPSGVFPVQWKRKDHHSTSYDAPMPYTLRLTDDGVAIHGSDVRWGRATHGCIGVPLEFARRLFDVVRKGDEVLIIGGTEAQARA